MSSTTSGGKRACRCSCFLQPCSRDQYHSSVCFPQGHEALQFSGYQNTSWAAAPYPLLVQDDITQQARSVGGNVRCCAHTDVLSGRWWSSRPSWMLRGHTLLRASLWTPSRQAKRTGELVASCRHTKRLSSGMHAGRGTRAY